MPNYIDGHIGAKLGEIRSLKNMSRSQLGSAAGLGASEIEAYENAALRLPAPAMLALCRALCVPPQRLFENLYPCPRMPAAMPVQLEALLREREPGR